MSLTVKYSCKSESTAYTNWCKWRISIHNNIICQLYCTSRKWHYKSSCCCIRTIDNLCQSTKLCLCRNCKFCLSFCTIIIPGSIYSFRCLCLNRNRIANQCSHWCKWCKCHCTCHTYCKYS